MEVTLDPSIMAGLKAVGTKAAWSKVGVGAVAAMTTTSEELKSAWPMVTVLLVPLAGAAYFMGQVVTQLEHVESNVVEKIDIVNKSLMGELAVRDLKIDYSYDKARQGGRYTAEMAREHDEQDDQRYFSLHERISTLEHNCKENQRQIDELGKWHAFGVPHMRNNNGDEHKL